MRSVHDREILRLAVPALGALIAEPLYVLADTAVVGRIGTVQLDGLALASTVLITVLNIFIFLAYGTTAAVSRLLGARNHERAAGQAVQALWLATMLGIVLAVLLFLFGPALLRALGGSAEIRDEALIYLRISVAGLPAMFITMAGVGYLRGLQDTTTPLIVTAISAVANLAIELVLIGVLDFGIGASALSTVVAQTGAGAVYAVRVLSAARAAGAMLRPQPGIMRGLLKIGGDLIVRTIALRGIFTITTAVAARLGPIDLAAHHIVFEIFTFIALALDAIAIAGQALVGTFLGADDAASARSVARRMMQWAIGTGLAAGIVVLASSYLVPGIFSTDPAVIDLARFLLLALAALLPAASVAFVLDGILIGAGDMRFLAVAMVIVAALYWPAAILLMITGAGIGWLWAGLGGVMVARTLLLGHRYLGDRWLVTGT